MASIGIDLGTTTTLLAEAQVDPGNGAITGVVLPIRQKRRSSDGTFDETDQSYLPSIAFFPETGPDAGSVFVGAEARTRAAQNTDDSARRTLRAVKRFMGRGMLLPPPFNQTPADVSALYLAHVIGDARTQGIFTDRDELTVTVPASFTSNQRKDTIEALQKALQKLGARTLDAARLKRVLISEPVAALLDYISNDLKLAIAHRRIDVGRRPLVLVYDMGGGTLDLTLVQLSWKSATAEPTLANLNFEIKDVSRYNQFAGEDFDQLVAKSLLKKLVERHPQLNTLTLTPAELRTVRNTLIDDAEKLKIELNQEFGWSVDDASVSFDYSPLNLQGKEYLYTGMTVTGADYMAWVNDFLEPRNDMKNATYPIDVFLQRNGVQREAISHFLLVGGMGQFIPLQNALRKWWKRTEGFIAHPTPEKAVAQGAAVYSELKAADPNYTIQEPAADAYYVRRFAGFSLLLDREVDKHAIKEKYELSGTGKELLLFIFAGDPPPANSDIESIYPTLVYQGRVIVPLKREYPAKTAVWIQMSYAADDSTKVPHIEVWVDEPDNLVHSMRLSDL